MSISGSGSDSLERVRTCQNCVRAKIRCSRASTAQSCDRCLRLHKECYFRPTKARNPKKRATRIGALEDKVDLILGQINHGSISSPQKDLLPSPQSEICDSQNNNSRHPCDVIGKGLITHDEADRLLESYHNAIPNFPYVQLPRGVTSEDLRSEKPFLLLSVLLVSSFQNVPLHLALEEVSTSYLGSTVLQGDYPQPLDTIQGLLVTAAGSKKKLHLKRFSGYLHLVNSIIKDCRMDYPSKLRVVRQRLDVMSNTEPQTKSIATQNEEARALIGYFLLDSCHSVVTQRSGTMPWSPFIESTAAKLSQEGEFPSDQYLLSQVQMQHMLERVDSLVRRGFVENQATLVDVDAMVRSLQNEAKEYRALFPAIPRLDVIVRVQNHAFEIHLYQTTFFDVFPSSTAVVDQSLVLFRIDALCHGLAAAKQFIDFFFSLPTGIEKTFSYFQWISTGFCLAASCKLALASLEPSVRYHDQVKGLRETLNMPYELQRLANRMEALDKECKAGKWDEHEIFFYQEWLRHLSDWFDGQHRLAQSDSAGENNNGLSLSAVGPSESNIYGESDSGFPWVDLQDVAIEEMLNAWLVPAGMTSFP